MFATINETQIFYTIDMPAKNPENAPWVTFITGITNDTTMWDGQIGALKDQFRILRFDLPGQGESQVRQGDYSVETLAQDTLGLLDHLKIAKTNLVALGLGSPIAMRLAIDHPERVISLAPCCCRAKMEPEFAAMWHKLMESVKQNGIASIVENTAQRWFSEDFKVAYPKVIDRVRQMISKTSVEGYLGNVSAFLGTNLDHEVHKISIPTIFIGGAEDKVGGPEHIMAAIAAKVKNSIHALVPHAAHIANLQNEEGFNQILKDFLEKQNKIV
ncbi:MAG: alpha/beta hydrolase [Betaproteobacteria bacterium]|jgi:3-oxoadipate enol-lactonase